MLIFIMTNGGILARVLTHLRACALAAPDGNFGFFHSDIFDRFTASVTMKPATAAALVIFC